MKNDRLFTRICFARDISYPVTVVGVEILIYYDEENGDNGGAGGCGVAHFWVNSNLRHSYRLIKCFLQIKSTNWIGWHIYGQRCLTILEWGCRHPLFNRTIIHSRSKEKEETAVHVKVELISVNFLVIILSVATLYPINRPFLNFCCL